MSIAGGHCSVATVVRRRSTFVAMLARDVEKPCRVVSPSAPPGKTPRARAPNLKKQSENASLCLCRQKVTALLKN
jgi:hypothetical protein